jgi:hypothetical protein
MSNDFDDFLESKKIPPKDEASLSWNSIASKLAGVCKDKTHNTDGFISKENFSVMGLGEVQARLEYRNQQYFVHLEMRPLTPMEQWSSRPLRTVTWELKPKYASNSKDVAWNVDDGDTDHSAARTATEIAKGLVDFYNVWEEQKQSRDGDDEDWH